MEDGIFMLYFDIVYQPGIENIPPDTLLWGYCNAMTSENGSLAV